MPKTRTHGVAGALMGIDRATRDLTRPLRGKPIVKALAWASEIGDQPQMYAVSTAVLAAGLARGDRRMTRAGVRMLAAHWLATAAKDFAKHRVDRTRPRSTGSGRDHKPREGSSKAKEETSFPSGHSAGALAVARAFAREYPERQAPALAAAGMVAIAQVPRSAHYPTDVGAGLAIGFIAEAAIHAAFSILWPGPALAAAG